MEIEKKNEMKWNTKFFKRHIQWFYSRHLQRSTLVKLAQIYFKKRKKALLDTAKSMPVTA